MVQTMNAVKNISIQNKSAANILLEEMSTWSAIDLAVIKTHWRYQTYNLVRKKWFLSTLDLQVALDSNSWKAN